MKGIIIATGFLSILLFPSCEFKLAQQERLAREEQERIEFAKKQEQERIVQEKRLEEERSGKMMPEEGKEQMKQEEPEGQEREVYNRYINNSLQTGTTPYRRYYGDNSSCKESGCSQIKVTTPQTSDVLVTIKNNDRVVRHAYICANSSYTFEMPNGTYQPFFYYGKGWSPEKEMKRADGTSILGGFVSGEVFGKDDPQKLDNNILEYILILQPNGNFSTIPSNSMEAL